jgi:hypothetical protein
MYFHTVSDTTYHISLVVVEGGPEPQPQLLKYSSCRETFTEYKDSHFSEKNETLYPAIMRSQATHELPCILFKVNQIYRPTFVRQTLLKTVQTSVELFASC